MSNPSLNCKKCQKGLNYLPYHSYAEPPSLKSKEGEFYCFDCFKSISHWIAQMNINIHDKKTWHQSWEKIYFREAEHIKPFDMCGRYCDFFCSSECLARDDNRNCETKKKQNEEKLQQGWKYCEECVELFEDLFAKTHTQKKVEEAISYHANVVPLEEKICKFHKRSKEKNLYVNQVILPKAQKWWDSLTYAEKLSEVKKLGINWIAAEKRKAAHEEVASRKEVPPFLISQKFEHEEPCASCGKTWKAVCEINCGKNSPNGKTSHCASCPSSSRGDGISTENETNSNTVSVSEIQNKQMQLQKVKEVKGKSSEEVRKLEQEIRALSKKGQKSSSVNKNLTKNKITVYSITGFTLLSLIGFVIILARSKRKNTKIK